MFSEHSVAQCGVFNLGGGVKAKVTGTSFFSLFFFILLSPKKTKPQLAIPLQSVSAGRRAAPL